MNKLTKEQKQKAREQYLKDQAFGVMSTPGFSKKQER